MHPGKEGQTRSYWLSSQILCHDRPRLLHCLDARRHAGQPHVLALTTWRLLAHEQEVQREADVERICIVDLLNVLAGELKRESGDVTVKMRLLAPSDDREDIGSLVEDISKAVISLCQLHQDCNIHRRVGRLTQPM
jgi:hypothetical protein